MGHVGVTGLREASLIRLSAGVKYRFGEREAQTIEETLDSDGDANRQGSEREAVPCPVCGVEMRKKRYRQTAQCRSTNATNTDFGSILAR